MRPAVGPTTVIRKGHPIRLWNAGSQLELSLCTLLDCSGHHPEDGSLENDENQHRHEAADGHQPHPRPPQDAGVLLRAIPAGRPGLRLYVGLPGSPQVQAARESHGSALSQAIANAADSLDVSRRIVADLLRSRWM